MFCSFIFRSHTDERLSCWRKRAHSYRNPQVDSHSPESGKAGQRSPAVWSPCLLPGGLGAGGPSGGGASVQSLGPFFTNLGLEFSHELVEVFAAAQHLPALVDGVDLKRRKWSGCSGWGHRFFATLSHQLTLTPKWHLFFFQFSKLLEKSGWKRLWHGFVHTQGQLQKMYFSNFWIRNGATSNKMLINKGGTFRRAYKKSTSGVWKYDFMTYDLSCNRWRENRKLPLWVCSPTVQVWTSACFLVVFPSTPVVSCLSGHPVSARLDVASHTHFLLRTAAAAI